MLGGGIWLVGRNGATAGSVYCDKSKKRWFAQITLGFDQDGKQELFKHSYKAKTDADNALACLQTQHEIGEVAAADQITLREMLEDWLAWKAPRDLRPTTQDSYERVIRLCLNLPIGSKRVQKLTKSDIEWAYESMQEPRRDHRGNGKTTELRRFLEATFDHHLFIAFFLGCGGRMLRLNLPNSTPKGKGNYGYAHNALESLMLPCRYQKPSTVTCMRPLALPC